LGWDLKVFFMKDRETFRSWDTREREMQYSYEILKGYHWHFMKKRWEIHYNPSATASLRQYAPHVVIIGGYNSLTSWSVLHYCKRNRIKVIMWSGSTIGSSTSNDGLIGILKSTFIRACDGFVAYGTKAGEYLQFYGINASKIFLGCNVGDVDFYRAYALITREDFHPPNECVNLLFVGQLIRSKGIFNLIEALKSVKWNNWHLNVLGEGPEHGNLEALAKNYNLADKITFAGFMQKEDLVKFFSMARVFVFPSLADKFSIVLSEALASGLYVIGSKYDGASYDLIKDGHNGRIVDPKNIVELAQSIEETIRDAHRLPSKLDVSDSISQYGVPYYADTFINAVRHVTNQQ